LVLSFAGQLTAGRRNARGGIGSRQPPGRARLIAVGLGLAAAAASFPALSQPADAHEDALTVSGISGEILDTAVEHCRRGEREQAAAMFAAILDQLEPPPGIARVVRDLQATGCHGSFLAEARGLRVQVGGGWDSNVSQGITARTLTIGAGGNAIDLQLDETYRPRSSTFVQASVDYSLPVPVAGLTVRGGLAQRHNASARAFDLSSASLGVAKDIRVAGETVRAQAEHAEVWLGSVHFQRSDSIGAQWLGSTPQWAWLGHVLASRASYITQPSQDARLYEAGFLLERRLSPAASVYGQFAWQVDNAAGPRAGGDRKGYQARVGALLLAEGWQFRPQAGYASWNSEDLFAPGLLDTRRENRLTQLVLQAERPITPQTSLVLEWSGRSSRDTIALYRYKAQVVTVTLAHRF
jgi:hypothetical protein